MKGYQLAVVYNNETASSATVSNVGQLWYDTAELWQTDLIYVNIDEEDPQAALEFINAVGIIEYPTVLYVEVAEDGTQQIVTRIEGYASYNKLLQTARSVIREEFEGWGEGNGNGLGLGIGSPASLISLVLILLGIGVLKN